MLIETRLKAKLSETSTPVCGYKRYDFIVAAFLLVRDFLSPTEKKTIRYDEKTKTFIFITALFPSNNAPCCTDKAELLKERLFYAFGSTLADNFEISIATTNIELI